MGLRGALALEFARVARNGLSVVDREERCASPAGGFVISSNERAVCERALHMQDWANIEMM